MRSRTSPARLATVGFQGFGNLGDEALLTGIEQLLAGSPTRVTTVFSGPRPNTVHAFPRAERVVTWRHLPTVRALRRLRRTDLLVLAGGGLYNDHWPAVVPRYAAWVLAARLAGARVAWIGVGVGPLRSAWSRALTHLAARLSQSVLVRDEESRDLLVGVDTEVMPDPSLFNHPPHIAGRRDKLGFVVRAPTRRHADRASSLIEALGEAADRGRAHGLAPVILTMGGPADAPFASAVEDDMTRRGHAVVVEALGPGVNDALERLTSFRALVAVRLHGMLLGALAGVPSAAVAYDDKVHNAARELGLADATVDITAVSGPLLTVALDAALREERAAQVADRVTQLRARQDEVVGRLTSVINAR
jgi:polysaccharide pyruvyl transferase WcaK-like protein